MIKFRVWDKELKCFISTNELDGNFGLNFNGELICLMATRDQDDFIYQQFIGLKDEKEKEIYEGDILKGQVNGNFEFSKPSKIAGNIFENPELLLNK